MKWFPLGLVALVFSGPALAGDLSGALSADAFVAGAGAPRAFGRLAFAPRWEAGAEWKIKAGFRLAAGSRPPAGRTRFADPLERGDFQPALQFDDLELRRLWSGAVRTEWRAGLLPLRWGRTDGFTPVDTLAPRDHTDLLEERRPAIFATLLALRGEKNGIEFVLIPVFAPDRLPPGLLGAGGRWSEPPPAALPPAPGAIRYRLDANDLPARNPREAEWGVRWERVGSRLEFALSARQGRRKIAAVSPVAGGIAPATGALEIILRRDWPRIRQYGAEWLVPAGSLLWRAEGAWVEPLGGGPGRLLYAAELEAQRGDWRAIAAYGGIHARSAAAAPSPLSAPAAGTGADLAQGGLPGLLFGLRREAVGEWGLRLDAIRGLDDGGWLLRIGGTVPRGDRLRLEAGLDLLGGPRASLYGGFQDERRFRIGATWSF